MSVTAPRGFVACGVHAGIRNAHLDLAVVRSLQPAVGAAMFTRNRVLAAPLIVSRRPISPRLSRRRSSSTWASRTRQPARAESRTHSRPRPRLPSSSTSSESRCSCSLTGVIGPALPMEKMTTGLAAAMPQLSEEGGHIAAEAILTTDTKPKEAVVARDGFVVGGMAKGAGMIHPALATMLAVLTTDYPLESGEARRVPHGPRSRRDLQPDLRRRRLLDQRRGHPARERRERLRARRRELRGRGARGLRRPRRAARLRCRGRHRADRDRGRGSRDAG